MIHTQDADFTLICADVLDGLRTLPDGSVHCVVTSPPYWGLRDYGTGLWAGGDEGCDHAETVARHDGGRANVDGFNGSSRPDSDKGAMQYRDVCGKCGATRQDQQLGLEATPDLYVARIVEVFREVRRVLRADGTCWVNLGDSYAAGGGFAPDAPSSQARLRGESVGLLHGASGANYMARANGPKKAPVGLKPKDLVGIPWRVAFALQADGWYLRSDIIWSKPNPMPESVTDRPTKAHEYVFLLSKEARYFFDQEAVREPQTEATLRRDQTPRGRSQNGGGSAESMAGYDYSRDGLGNMQSHPAGRNVRSVWEIATQPYPEAHFATYPEELVRRCVLAGTSERGCCPECGKPWEREVERGEEREQRPSWSGEGNAYGVNGGNHKGRTGNWGAETRSVGWKPACNCQTSPMTSSSVSSAENSGTSRIASTTTQGLCAPSAPQGTIPEPIPCTVPCTVLDPFLGSGTTAYVARKHGRRSIGIELNPVYCDLAARRMQQQSLLV